jgi:hypothetical protein
MRIEQKIVASSGVSMAIFTTIPINNPYRSELKPNDKLTAIKNGSSIRFLLNGIDQGEAVNNAPDEIYPFVGLYI